MSLQASTKQNIFIRSIPFFIFLLLSVFITNAFAEWSVDFSRRQKKSNVPTELPEKNISPQVETVDVRERQNSKFLDTVNDEPVISKFPAFEKNENMFSRESKTEESQDIAILNTSRGFIPNAIRMRQGERYKIHIVNVNEKERNSSFIIDAFAEHHATFFGQTKEIIISPQRDGVFTYVCPETAFSGRIVVLPKNNEESRLPAGTR